MGGCFAPPCLYMELPEEICFKITLIQSKKHSGLPSPAQGPFGNQRNQFFFFFRSIFPLRKVAGGSHTHGPVVLVGPGQGRSILSRWWPGRSRQGARAAFLTFPSGGQGAPGNAQPQLGSSWGHHKGPPWAAERGQVASGGAQGTGMVEGMQGAAGGTGRAPSLQPLRALVSTILPSHCSSRAEGSKGEFGGEGKDPIYPSLSKFRLFQRAPWLSWNSLPRGTGPDPRQMTALPSQCPPLMEGCHPCPWLDALGTQWGAPRGASCADHLPSPTESLTCTGTIALPQGASAAGPQTGSAHVPLLVENCPHPLGLPPELALSY